VTAELVVLLDGEEAGLVRQHAGRLSFVYSDGWRTSAAAYPLSLSMPLASTEHSHAKVDAFLWGLLPDNAQILEGWARRFHVSARNAFGLMAVVGEDCAGAVQFIRPERREGAGRKRAGEVRWLKASEVADRLRLLRADASAWRMAADGGQFSLAGAQAKTAFLREGDRWGIPSGRLPTTHILKPPHADFEGHAENEHFCLQLARALGLPVPNSDVMRFEDQIAIVIERYDRLRIGKTLRRVHQEDLCQALGLPPASKYENEGGPGAREIVELLRTYSSSRDQDVQTFSDALIFNWLIAGTDAHAKNYSLLLGIHGVVRLAPLYDLASVLPYRHIDPLKVKLAMKIGGAYRMRYVGARQWEKFASDVRLNADVFLARARQMAEAIPDQASTIRTQVLALGLSRLVIDRLCEVLVKRARACARVLKMKK
jgi:serine/threonine-protein kinase HipA